MQHAIRFNALQPKNAGRHLAGVVLVVLLHAAILLAAVYGLQRTGARLALPAELEWVSIVAPTPPPAPQPAHRPEAAKLTMQPLDAPTPPDFVIEPPAQRGDAINVPPGDTVTAVTGPVDTGGQSVAPSAAIGVACPNAQAVRAIMRYPAQARREGLQGDVLARFIVGAGGGIRAIEIVSTTHRAFNSAVVDAVQQFGCVGQGRDVTVEVPFNFRLE